MTTRHPPYLREIIVQYRSHPARIPIAERQITTHADAAGILIPLLTPEVVEVFLVLHLDAKSRVIGVQEIARGTLTHCEVTPRHVYTAAIGQHNSAAIILAHNHPSGDPTPSQDDLEITRRIVAAGAILEVPVRDHLIIGNGRYVSLKNSGRMEYLL